MTASKHVRTTSIACEIFKMVHDAVESLGWKAVQESSCSLINTPVIIPIVFSQLFCVVSGCETNGERISIEIPPQQVRPSIRRSRFLPGFRLPTANQRARHSEQLRIGGFHKWGYPQMHGLCQGKSHLEMDENWGYPHFGKPPIQDSILEGKSELSRLCLPALLPSFFASTWDQGLFLFIFQAMRQGMTRHDKA